MKTLRTILPAGLLAAAAAMPAAAQDYTFTFAHVLMEDTPNGQAAISFAEEVAEQSDGRIRINVLPAGQLGGDVEIIEQLQQNLVQIAIPPTATLGNFEPKLQVLDLPFIMPGQEAMETVLDGEAGRMILDTLDQHGMHGVNFWGAGFRQITNNVREVASAGDLEGVQMRTMQAPVILEQYRQWGASPTAMAFAEVYNGLQSGVVDGQENPIANIVSMRFYEVQDHITISNHAYHGYAAVVNEQAWNQLPDDLKEVMTEAFDNARDLARELTVDYEAEQLEAIGDEIAIKRLSDEELSAFIEASYPVHEAFADVVTPELIQTIYDATGAGPEQ
ncbi:TRAP transporter substrate-binding protein [Allosediminivita pacifica]|uniref:C4-dicarboxylate-binding protein DctP n=1 Tax=Allosediminivita pacifica TaxID=1267769 RepID=A0A2T6BA85_9RHOB|nr:TRAP transporter substrate-binding protein [Allosediminivita pacifica]PTX52977.1 C4-dicarboxylate-binding protein DctP [Allosediminivita pacifica]GGA94056.1 C4-dicarboxylate ABC transporter [Allosediminivita pacifica]